MAHHMGGQRRLAGLRGQHHRALECLEQPPRAIGKPAVFLCRFWPRKVTDRLRRPLRICEQVQRAAVRPEVARQQRLKAQGHMIVQPFAQIRKQTVEHWPQGENRGPSIDRPRHRVDHPHLAAGRAVAVKDRHIAPRVAQPQRGRQPAKARTDHHDLFFLGK